MRILWSDLASESIIEIIAYYELEVDEAFADSVEADIVSQVAQMVHFPRSIPETDIFPNARKLVIKGFPYVAFLRIRGDVLEVIDVVHTSRRLPKVL